ncbi:MAG: DNRLRE domain-containing protein [Deltaproteobacteria bacterium]|jgi:hypothetical protein|nr:DNRLRE domain-containing protein [Deltaproteobacteria bacterium]MBT6434928.1 DNRLRE domain-containing protein [Deltaproteobacteria bacterium]MBT6490410.1 DNRLRE domain-containing protein [Deltaproteobacteria bacterium]
MAIRISLILPIAFLSLTLAACSVDNPLSAIPDCAGVSGGDAVVDECGVCNGDNTQCADCAGVPYGDALADECGICDNDATNDCIQDCSETWGGDAVIDDCGVCDGDNTTCADCAGVPNGDSMLDECGVCDNDSTNDCTEDCTGTWGGDAILDECDVCEGDSSTCADCAGVANGDSVIDECGVCDNDATNDCTEDCTGTWGGDAILDECGVCEGDGSTCGNVSFGPVADAHVTSGSANSNYGLLDELIVDRGANETYLRFDLGANIPAGAYIESVNFKTTAHTGFAWGGDGNVYTYLVDDDTWAEEGITWNNRPAVSGTSLGSWWLWYDYSDNTIRTGEHSTEEMATTVQAELDNDGLISVRLHSPGYRTNYHSREFADASMRPRLEVAYLDCAGIPNGDAFVDTCDDCVGGTTGLEAGDCSEPEETGIVVGGGTTTLAQQGSCGYSSSTISCPAGFVAVGYQGQTGDWFDHVKLICQELLADGSLGGITTTSANGYSSGGSNVGPYYCSAGHVMVGGQVRAGDHLDYVRGRCMSIADVAAGSTVGYTSSADGMGNASGGGDYGDQLCPAGQAITGMIGGNAQYACRISWICSDIANN